MNDYKVSKMPKQRESQQNASMRTIRTVTQYNVGDYLPSHDSSQSRSIVQINHLRNKMMTEPVDKSGENEELLRKIVALQQEKLVLKVELERSKRDLIVSQQNLKQKSTELGQAQKKREQSQKQKEEISGKLRELEKKREPKVRLQRNTHHFQLFPKFKQSYQVSVQTDPTIEQHSLSKQIKNPIIPPSSDMQHIYQKMQSLKMGRKTTKPEMITAQPIFTSNLKGERPRAFTSNWNTYTKDKQNIMRNSNVMEKRTVEKLDKVRSENLQLFPMPLEQGEKLLAAYIQESYF